MWSWIIFKVCDRLKKTPREVCNCTLRELQFLIERINEVELYERAERVSLAGGDGQDIIDRHQMTKLEEQLISNETENAELLKLTLDLEKEFTNDN